MVDAGWDDALVDFWRLHNLLPVRRNRHQRAAPDLIAPKADQPGGSQHNLGMSRTLQHTNIFNTGGTCVSVSTGPVIDIFHNEHAVRPQCR